MARADVRLLENGNKRLLETNFRLLLERQPAFLAFGLSGRIGKSGDSDPYGVNGIYQMRMTKRGKVPVKMRFYAPTNPQTQPQEANRTKFAAAMSGWMALTDEQKAAYIQRAKRRGMFGWGLFIREYYQSN
jgi:hypothetical protein